MSTIVRDNSLGQRADPSWLLRLAAIVVIVAALYLAKGVLVPLTLAVLLSFLLSPVCDWLERRKFGRVPAVLLTGILGFSLLGIVLWTAVVQMTSLAPKIPEYQRNVKAKLNSVNEYAVAALSKVTSTAQGVGEKLTPAELGDVPRGTNERPFSVEELRDVIQRQVKQLTHLSDDLLDVARITEGKLELHREQVGLRQLIDHACEEVRPLINCCGHQLTVSMPAEPITVSGDPSRLLQVFANLIQNAAKFTECKGNLCVIVESQGHMAVVRVCDNGPGIDEQNFPKIFEAFTQVDHTRTPANDGLGIGLRLVKTIVELHGGTVAAPSDGLGRGCEFTVQLPMMDAVARQPPATNRPTADRDAGSFHFEALVTGTFA